MLTSLQGTLVLTTPQARSSSNLAGELERNIVAILQQRDAGARVLADVEGFVLREHDRGGVFHGIPGHFLAVNVEDGRPSLPCPSQGHRT